MKSRIGFCGAAAAALMVTLACSTCWAGKRTPDAATDTLEMFVAMKSGEVNVQYIPRDATSGTLLITNKTEKPLAIKLPDAFAAVPALAQFGGGGMGGGMGGGGMGGMGGMGGGGGGGGQSVGGGGGTGGGTSGSEMGGGGAGIFNVLPQKVRKVKAVTMCLEHGKPDPTPRMKYIVVPVEQFTNKPEVIELCKMLGRGEIPPKAAQAAAWRLANGLSWEELASKDRVRLLNGYVEKWFAPQDIALAMQIAGVAVHRGKLQSPETLSGGASLSGR